MLETSSQRKYRNGGLAASSAESVDLDSMTSAAPRQHNDMGGGMASELRCQDK